MKLFNKLAQNCCAALFIQLMLYSVLVLSFMTLVLGILGIIEHKSPENMASLINLSYGFLIYFEYHVLIISGAFGLTFTTWMLKHKT